MLWKCFASLALLAALFAEARAENSPTWRGAAGTGVSAETRLPIHWGKDQNVRWRVALPEPGNSTPIVWGDCVFVTQPLAKENRRTLMCFNRADGTVVWQSGVTYAEKESTHTTNPYCSSSPVTDGRRVVVWFGSAGLFCYDLNGHELWRRDLGKVGHIWGYGSSPALFGDLCFLNFGPGNPSYVLAVNIKTGEDVWRFDVPLARPANDDTPLGGDGSARGPELFGSWATPLVIDNRGRAELVLNLPQRVVACDPQTGRELWSCGGLGDLVYASPIWGEGVLVALGGYNSPSLAVRPDGAGDLTETARLWRTPRSRLRLGCGVIAGGHLYITDMQGIAECQELATGKTVWEHRLVGADGKNDLWSSMLLADGKIYLLNQAGDTFVYKASPDFELLATNSLGEASNSSVVASDGELFLRTQAALWCVGGSQ